MKRIIWRGNRAHDLMSTQHAGRASFFVSQYFDAHELTLKSCSRVLDLMQISSDANRISDRGSLDPCQANDFVDRRSALADWTNIFELRSPIAITQKRNISVKYLLSPRVYSVPVIDCDSFAFHRRLRPRIVARAGDYRVCHPCVSQRVSLLLSSVFPSFSYSLSPSLKDYLNLPRATKDFRLFPREIILQTPVLCFEDRCATWP